MDKVVTGQTRETITATWTGKSARWFGGILLQPGAPRTVPFDFVANFGYERNLHFDFAPYADRLRTHTPDGRPAFDMWCPLSSVDGYGRHALDIWRGLLQIDCDVSLRNNGGFVDQQFLPGDVNQARIAGMYQLPSKVGLAMSVPYDPQLSQHQSITKLCITQFETNRIPERHVEAVNRCDHLIVTSRFQVPIWKRCGVRRPISQLTPGVDTDFFSCTERPKDGKFKVLMLGALTERKNPMGAVRIFQEASERNPDWRLTIKTRRAKGIDAVARAIRPDPRIRLVVGDSHPLEVRQLYQTHDAFIFPSKGEGVGLPPLEAMSTGMELICADNSGMHDYIDDRWCWPIRTEREEPAGPPYGFDETYVNAYGDVGNWFVPDEKHGARQLKRCFDAWYEGRGKGQRAAQMVRERHTLQVQARSVLKIVQEYL